MLSLPTTQVFALLLLLAALLQRLYAYGHQRLDDHAFGKEHGCKPAGCYLPYKWPFSLDIIKKHFDALPSRKVLALWQSHIDSLESTFSVHFFGATGYATTDPRNIDAINRLRFEDWSLGFRRGSLLPFLGDGIFTQDGGAWRHSRELISRQFRRIDYDDLEVMKGLVDELIVNIASTVHEVDLQPLFYQFTLSTTTQLLFGEPIDNLGEQVVKEFSESMAHASEIVAKRMWLADVHWLYGPRSFTKACMVVRKYADRVVQKALIAQDRLGPDKAFELYPFIIDLYRASNDAVKVRDQLVNVLIAGRDSTADTLGWTFFHLVRHPKVLIRLREEINANIGDEVEKQNAVLKQLPYLNAVIKEILRLYPQLPVNMRFASRITTLPYGGGADGRSPILIPKGTACANLIYHMQQRTDLFGHDARSFRPERWLTGELSDLGSAYVPFHSGPRTCLGKHFAMTQIRYLVVRLLQAFPEMHLPSGTIIDSVGMEKQDWSLLVSSGDGCKVELK